MYVHRLRHYLGAYAFLGRLDLVVFTAGVGENSRAAGRRSRAGGLGLRLDEEPNAAPSKVARIISTDHRR